MGTKQQVSYLITAMMAAKIFLAPARFRHLRAASWHPAATGPLPKNGAGTLARHYARTRASGAELSSSVLHPNQIQSFRRRQMMALSSFRVV